MTRVFIGYSETSGYFGNLADGFEAAGIKVSFAELKPHEFEYADDRSPWIFRHLRKLMEKKVSRFRVGLWKALAALWMVLRHRIIIISCTDSLFESRPFLELRLARLFRRRIIVVFTGSESRPNYMDLYGLQDGMGRVVTGGDLLKLTKEKAQRVTMIESLADVVVSNPLSSQFCTKTSCSFYAIGFPTRPVAESTPSAAGFTGRPIRILHSPSNPVLKGSHRILGTIENLRKRGLAIDYREISGVAHSVVLDSLQWCDLVVDQLYSDTPMAGLVREAASFGKPSVVGGYGWKEFAGAVETSRTPPSFACHPDALEEALFEFLNSPEQWEEVGKRARSFVEENWNPKEVATRMLRLAEEKAPREWFFEPCRIQYHLGCGIVPVQVQMMVRSLVAFGGEEALCLCHNPALSQKLIQFAEANKSDSLEVVMELERKLAVAGEALSILRGSIAELDKKIESAS